MWRKIRKTIKNSIRLFFAKRKNNQYETGENTNVPNMLKDNETVNQIVKHKKSLVRYGDGDFGSCLYPHKKVNYQSGNKKLAAKLAEILKTPKDNVIVGIPNIFANLDRFKQTDSLINISGKQFWQLYLSKKTMRKDIYSLLNFNMQYADSLITRPYMSFIDNSKTDEKFNNLSKIWQDRNIIFVEGELTRLGLGNDLFNNATSIKRIIAPATDAFNKIDKIIEECKKQDKDSLFILALGPTATVLGYELAEIGYQAIDVGHVDIEYEWFKQKATTKVAIANKYTYEANHGKNSDELKQFTDEKYESQIIAKIL